jgi:ArsR family transcriptional regulator, cadmium/lead-responsive transcriptional repressor
MGAILTHGPYCRGRLPDWTPSLEHRAQLRLGRRALNPAFRAEHATTHPDRFRACRSMGAANPCVDINIHVISCFPDMYLARVTPTDRSAAARFFRVLGDPTRLQILQLLDARELTVGELVAAVGQPQPRVSTHLACLRYCGFVTTERRGKEIVYSLAFRGIDRVIANAEVVLEPIAERLATCTRIGPEWV